MSKKIMKIILSSIMALSITCSVFSEQTLAQDSGDDATEKAGQRTVLEIKENEEEVQYRGIDEAGKEFVVGAEKITDVTRNSSNTWRVYYNGVGIMAEFYMVVINNRCSSVYGGNVNSLGTISNRVLSRSSNYGLLTFNFNNGYLNRSLWLKGATTGANNNINVTWSM